MSRRAALAGLAAMAGMAAFYAGVVGAASGAEHLASQARADWPYLAAIVAGFGVQVSLLVEIRRRRVAARGAASAAGVGAGASAVGMVACCAHHLADLLPLVGVAGVAGFLTDWRIPIMLGGIALNAVGVAVAVRRLRRIPRPASRETELCAAA